MDEKTTYWASVTLGALALVLLVINISLINGNRHTQDDLNQRQAIINSGVTLSQVNKGLVQALADASVKSGDNEVRDLLAAQGITIKPNAKSEKVDEPAKKKSEVKGEE